MLIYFFNLKEIHMIIYVIIILMVFMLFYVFIINNTDVSVKKILGGIVTGYRDENKCNGFDVDVCIDKMTNAIVYEDSECRKWCENNIQQLFNIYSEFNENIMPILMDNNIVTNIKDAKWITVPIAEAIISTYTLNNEYIIYDKVIGIGTYNLVIAINICNTDYEVKSNKVLRIKLLDGEDSKSTPRKSENMEAIQTLNNILHIFSGCRNVVKPIIGSHTLFKTLLDNNENKTMTSLTLVEKYYEQNCDVIVFWIITEYCDMIDFSDKLFRETKNEYISAMINVYNIASKRNYIYGDWKIDNVGRIRYPFAYKLVDIDFTPITNETRVNYTHNITDFVAIVNDYYKNIYERECIKYENEIHSKLNQQDSDEHVFDADSEEIKNMIQKAKIRLGRTISTERFKILDALILLKEIIAVIYSNTDDEYRTNMSNPISIKDMRDYIERLRSDIVNIDKCKNIKPFLDMLNEKIIEMLPVE